MLPFVNISRMKTVTLESLKDAVSKFENHIYKSMPVGQVDISGIQSQISALQNQVNSLVISQWPGFGSYSLHAMRGDFQDSALKFFSKSATQTAVVGANTIAFDTTVPFSSIPQVSCWIINTDPYGINPLDVSGTLTTTEFTVNIDLAGTIFYIATGLR